MNEEGMVVNAPGQSGGFTSSSHYKPTSYDTTLKFDGRNKYVKRNIKDLMDRKENCENKKRLRL